MLLSKSFFRRWVRGLVGTAGVVAVFGLSLGLPGLSKDAAAATKVKYAEVVRSVFYLPKYIAIANGYFGGAPLNLHTTVFPSAWSLQGWL